MPFAASRIAGVVSLVGQIGQKGVVDYGGELGLNAAFQEVSTCGEPIRYFGYRCANECARVTR